MSTIAEFELKADEFVLDDTFERFPELEVEVEQVVAHGDGKVMPFIWVSSDDLDGVEAALEADDSTDNVRRLTEVDDRRLYQMEWVAHIEFIVHVLLDEGGTILDASGLDGGWHLRVLFPDREGLSRTHDYCEEHGMDLAVKRIYELEETSHGRYGLSEEQYETLVLAYEKGHFDVPRESSLETLADHLGISHQALSERLRRGHRELVKNTLIVGEEANSPDI